MLPRSLIYRTRKNLIDGNRAERPALSRTTRKAGPFRIGAADVESGNRLQTRKTIAAECFQLNAAYVSARRNLPKYFLARTRPPQQ